MIFFSIMIERRGLFFICPYLNFKLNIKKMTLNNWMLTIIITTINSVNDSCKVNMCTKHQKSSPWFNK